MINKNTKECGFTEFQVQEKLKQQVFKKKIKNS